MICFDSLFVAMHYTNEILLTKICHSVPPLRKLSRTLTRDSGTELVPGIDETCETRALTFVFIMLVSVLINSIEYNNIRQFALELLESAFADLRRCGYLRR